MMQWFYAVEQALYLLKPMLCSRVRVLLLVTLAEALNSSVWSLFVGLSYCCRQQDKGCEQRASHHGDHTTARLVQWQHIAMVVLYTLHHSHCVGLAASKADHRVLRLINRVTQLDLSEPLVISES